MIDYLPITPASLNGPMTTPSRWRIFVVAVIMAGPCLGTNHAHAGGNVVAVCNSTAKQSIGSVPVMVSDWSVQCQQANGAIVTWVCPSFHHQKNSQHSSDAQVKLTPLDQVGPVSAAIVRETASSHSSSGSESACVSAAVSGTGVVHFRVVVVMNVDNDLMPAGDYSTALNTAVISH
jgi:hypothetical protein